MDQMGLGYIYVTGMRHSRQGPNPAGYPGACRGGSAGRVPPFGVVWSLHRPIFRGLVADAVTVTRGLRQAPAAKFEFNWFGTRFGLGP